MQKINLGVVGSRGYSNFPKFARTLASKIDELGGPQLVRIISGGAKGPDRWAEKFARAWGMEFKVYPVVWKIDGTYNPAAGLERNTLIVNDADELLAFWDGTSNGTNDSITKAQSKGIPYTVIDES